MQFRQDFCEVHFSIQRPVQWAPDTLLPGVKLRSLKMATHLYLLSRIRTSGTILHPLWPCMAWTGSYLPPTFRSVMSTQTRYILSGLLPSDLFTNIACIFSLSLSLSLSLSWVISEINCLSRFCRQAKKGASEYSSYIKNTTVQYSVLWTDVHCSVEYCSRRT